MAKVLLVEDDQNLREIFEMRLQAEGYETLVASDGEEALAVALQQKPDLIIADIMMPKLSGFEMLETLRAAPDMSNVKVIIMTALGQTEDRARGERLGVIKYLVKSQVTLEDFVRAVREVLPPAGDMNAQGSKNNKKQESENKMQDDTAQTNPTGQEGSTPPTNPVAGDTPAPSTPPADDQMTSAQEQNVVNDQVNSFAGSAPTTPPAGDDGAPDTGAPSLPTTDEPPVPGPQPPVEEPPKPPLPEESPTAPPAGTPPTSA